MYVSGIILLIFSLTKCPTTRLAAKGLKNVSRVNCVCYKAAVQFLYQHLKIEISPQRKLKERVKGPKAKPLHRHFLFHAQSLKLLGRMPQLSEDTDEDDDSSPYPDDDTDFSKVYEAEFKEIFVRDLSDGSPEEVAKA
ncbi:hypothetical protein F5884DRAFT_779412 [Xylogone sp. PMI_703]|nr:hypothetical protein F5884DRAFT_779412 [Xylogone sp. PMI_703]